MPNRATAKPIEFATFPAAYRWLVPTYEYYYYYPLYLRIKRLDSKWASSINAISPKRAEDRWNNYVSEDEISRVLPFFPFEQKRGVTFRFGVKKSGKGIAEKRDFCMLAGIIQDRDLTVFYRSLELTGGLLFDLAVLGRLGDRLGVHWRSLTIFANSSEVHSVHSKTPGKIGSNFKLYDQIQKLFDAP